MIDQTGVVAEMGDHSPAISLSEVTVQFGQAYALDGVGFSVERGEIVSLMGENGAGKSTLMRVAAGLQKPSSGHLSVDGVERKIASVDESRAAGIRLVPQELTLASDLSIAENISLGVLPNARGVVDKAEMRRIAQERMERLGLQHVDVDMLVEHAPVVVKTFVQIARALSDGAKVLILDEPTAPMSDPEVETFLSVVMQIAASGIAVLYVSHRLDEVFRISDRVIVLRDGKLILDSPLAAVQRIDVIQAMVGGRDLSVTENRAVIDEPVVLGVRDLTTTEVDAVSFDVHAGEIAALYGIAGSGREYVGAAIIGADPHATGEVAVDGTVLAPRSITASIAAGVGYLAPERRALGLLFESSIRDNLTLTTLRKFSRWGVISAARERAIAERWRAKLKIMAPSIATVIGTLSGGNQQKVLIARALESSNRVLILEEPTRGVDIATKAEIYRLLAELAQSGLGILVISSDLEEVSLVASRVLVIRRGRLVADALAPEQSTIAAVANSLTEEEVHV